MHSIARHPLLAELEGQTYFTITGVDPGSTTLGVFDMHVEIETLKVAGIEYRTFNANKAHNGLPVDDWMAEIYAERAMRMRELAWRFGHHLAWMRPMFIAFETAYFDMATPSAFIPLAECIKTLEIAVYNWNAFRPVYRIDTGTAKKSIAPETKELLEEFRALSRSKELPNSKAKVRWCAERHSEFSQIIKGHNIDEHSLDAGVIAYAQLLRIRNNDFTIVF